MSESRSSGSDPLAEFQRWLVRSSAKNLGREVRDQVRKVTGGGGNSHADVWETATTEPPPGAGESPECAWCPLCRAARRFRDSGPGLASQVAGAGDALFSVAQDAVAAFEATLSARPPAGGPSRYAPTSAVAPAATGPVLADPVLVDPVLVDPAAAHSPRGTGWPADSPGGHAWHVTPRPDAAAPTPAAPTTAAPTTADPAPDASAPEPPARPAEG